MKSPVVNSRLPVGPAGQRQGGQLRTPRSVFRVASAFSLIEILIVVLLLSVIIIGLVAMFSQTQRAFRLGMTQVDVLESGRMATDLLVRELEQVTPTYQTTRGRIGNNVMVLQPNFYAWRQDYWPLIQALPGSSNSRTNLIEDLFFVYRRNQEWVGVGYFVRIYDPVTRSVGMPVVGTNPQKAGVGVLYRFESSAFPLTQKIPANLFDEFFNVAFTNRWLGNTLPARIIDGVAHFKLRAYDTNGFCLTNDLPHNTNFSKSFITKAGPSTPLGEIDRYTFFSNAVPASVELELGILEDRAWERFVSLPDNISRYRYITNQAGRVHVFRQRVPIRNVDPAAYR